MTGPEVTQPDPDGVEMTDGEWATFRGLPQTPDRLAEIEARIEQARADYDAIQGYEESSLTERIALQHAAERVYPLTNDVEALIAVVKAVREIHRPIHMSDGRQICAICLTVTPSGALAPTLHPCPTARSLEAM